MIHTQNSVSNEERDMNLSLNIQVWRGILSIFLVHCHQSKHKNNELGTVTVSSGHLGLAYLNLENNKSWDYEVVDED